jgi:8-oxo-dGTP diphosphatase
MVQPELNPPPHTYAVRVGVASLIFNDEGFLLLLKRKGRHEGGTWSVPGGHMDFGETPEEASIREAKEESDVTIGNVRFLGFTNDVFEHTGRHYITLWMRAEWTDGEPRIAAPDEVEEIGWYPLDALPGPLFLPLKHLLEGTLTRSQEEAGNKAGISLS